MLCAKKSMGRWAESEGLLKAGVGSLPGMRRALGVWMWTAAN